MKNRNFADCFKNVMGTVFLLAGAFFVCSTFLSIRAVFADPVAPVVYQNTGAQSPRNNNVHTSRSSRSSVNTVSRATTPNAASRNISSRATAGRGTGVSATGRTNASLMRGNVASRNVVSRGNSANTRSTNTNTNVARSVRQRSAVVPVTSRVSLQGNAIRGSKAATSTYTYLSGVLSTGNRSNIIDSSTGLISAEAYNNCMESYYACMDEICTARNVAQRRCACAGRVKSFAEAETALESANEELIRVSGELALLVATKGKDVSQAFQLTDAEKVMNCVSWQEQSKNGTATEAEFGDWCEQHAIYDGSCSRTNAPTYCKESGNDFGFDISDLDGTGSDILASLQSWADVKQKTLTIITSDDESLNSAFDNLSNVISNLAGIDGAFADSDEVQDSLANTWGYELFEYAHNNVCNRVLDSCFNGIYEACGAPPSGGRKCGNGASQCPYNYNSMISVSNTGTYELNFVTPNSGYTASNSATCFGYTSSSGDPYDDLRGPVADARRSILQKYALDANADCDAYGEQLRTTAQNIGYQKVAAQQALQQKRMEFIREEQETTFNDAVAGITNYNECMSEILDCYETQARANTTWSNARIKTYCAQVASVPHCYETMICHPSTAQFKAVIDKADSTSCTNTQDYATNTCRNVITLNEILNGTGASELPDDDTTCSPESKTCNSAALRETCLQNSFVKEIRNWSPSVK